VQVGNFLGHEIDGIMDSTRELNKQKDSPSKWKIQDINAFEELNNQILFNNQYNDNHFINNAEDHPSENLNNFNGVSKNQNNYELKPIPESSDNNKDASESLITSSAVVNPNRELPKIEEDVS